MKDHHLNIQKSVHIHNVEINKMLNFFPILDDASKNLTNEVPETWLQVGPSSLIF